MTFCEMFCNSKNIKQYRMIWGEHLNPFIYAPDLASSKFVKGPIMSVTQA